VSRDETKERTWDFELMAVMAAMAAMVMMAVMTVMAVISGLPLHHRQIAPYSS